MNLRHSVGKCLINLGFIVYGDLPEQISVSDTKTILGKPKDAVVESKSIPEQWQPEQHGNVVIAEPKLMNLHRRGKL